MSLQRLHNYHHLVLLQQRSKYILVNCNTVTIQTNKQLHIGPHNTEYTKLITFEHTYKRAYCKVISYSDRRRS